jgi:hypothetical protein
MKVKKSANLFMVVVFSWAISVRLYPGRMHLTPVSKDQAAPTKDAKPTLRFNENHKFTILQITDLHYGPDWFLNYMNTEIQRVLIRKVKPDLIVVTGDMVSGYLYDGKTPNFFKSKWDQCTGVYAETKTPYAFTFGNHDSQADLSNVDIGKLESSHPYSLLSTTPEIKDGSYSNYNLKVLSSFENHLEEASAILWLFDTRATGCEDNAKSYGCLSKQQIDWYSKTSETLIDKNRNLISGFAFFHIPLQEYLYLWNFGKVYGIKGEQISCPAKSTNLFQKFLDLKNIKAMFCGHDHNNDFGGDYYGIELVYGRKTGYGSYGPNGLLGARVIELTEQVNESTNSVSMSYDHYIMDQNGDIIQNGEPRARGMSEYQDKCYTD